MFRNVCATAAVAWSLVFSSQAATEYNLLPNGSFEFWTRFGEAQVAAQRERGPSFEGDDPEIPVRWAVSGTRSATLWRASESRQGGADALGLRAPRGAWAAVEMAWLETNPGSEYGFGVWVKGEGAVTVRILGQALEGRQELAGVQGAAGADWTLVGGRFTAPRHLRLVCLQVQVSGAADLRLDDAHIRAALDQPFDADAVLRDRFETDADTLLLVDFDTPSESLILNEGARLSEPGEGRFGRGLRLDRPGTALLSLPALARMPEAGTLEFWFSPDAWTPGTQSYYADFIAGDQSVATLGADTSNSLRFGWRINDERYGKRHTIPASSAIGLARFRRGEWRHVALSWDESAVRYYLDGVLVGLHTEPPLPWWQTPSVLRFGAAHRHLLWDGSIDEVRFSRGQRYLTPVPAGAERVRLPRAEAPPAAPEPGKTTAMAWSAEELAAARRGALGQVLPSRPGSHEREPDGEGRYVYEAASARPLIEGGPLKQIDRFGGVEGLSAAEFAPPYFSLGMPQPHGLYWKLDAIQPGAYWLGLLHESQAAASSIAVYLNGRIVQTSTMSDPVQVAPGVWVSELQAAAAETLRAGDEVAVVSPGRNRLRSVRLWLRSSEPARGAHRAYLHAGGRYGTPYTALRLAVFGEFLDVSQNALPGRNAHFGQEQTAPGAAALCRDAEGRGVARFTLFNPLHVPVTVEYRGEIKGYYGQVAGRDGARLTLAPHSSVERRVSFELADDEPAYSLSGEVRAVDPPDLGWPEADTLAFFPGLRQSVPWPDPFSFRVHRRVVFSEPAQDRHRTLSLDGWWEIMLTRALEPPMPPPADQAAERIRVPAPYSHVLTDLTRVSPRAHGAYFRRAFALPEATERQTIRLVIDGVVAEATAYVNGRRVGQVRGERTPLVADVSTAVRPGENELVVVVRDMLAIMNPAYVNPRSPTPSPQYLDAAAGTFGRNNVGLGSVSLELAPTVSADGLFVIPSVRRGVLGARADVVNHGVREVETRVRATVLEARVPVLELGERTVRIPAGGRASLTWEQAWPDARRWEPADPHLYVLAVETVDAASGAQLDLARERFGFRESWIDPPHIMLNGRPIKLKGVTGGRALGCLDGEFDLTRGAWVPDYLDEFGLLATEPITGIYNSSSTHNVDRDAFWVSARANAVAAARRRHNHPSIIAWDLSNEWYGFLGYAGSDPLLGARRLCSVSDAVKAHDPTRWTFFNGDGSLSDLHDVYAGHYMVEGARRDPISGFRFNGHSSYFPDGAFWRPLDRPFEPGEPAHQHHGTVRYGETAWMNSENLWKVNRYMPPGLTKVGGEETVLSPAMDGASGPVLWFWKQNLDAHRDFGSSSISSYMVGGSYRRGYMRQAFILPDVVHHGFAGRTWTRLYSVHNDLFREAALLFRWRLRLPDGTAAAGGEARHAMGSAGLERGVLTLPLPEVEERTVCTLELRLEEEGRLVYGEERDITIWPDRPARPGALSRTVHLFDPEGRTAPVLAAAGVAFQTLARIAPPDGDPGAGLVIIGEHALDAALAPQVARLAPFVAQGGRVVVLAQRAAPGGLPVPLALEPREYTSQPFVRAAEHPVLKGLTSWDLHFWGPDHVSARGAYAKPGGGAAVPLVDSGTVTGLEWVQLMELYQGRGLYLLCQLSLAASYDEAPVARVLLARLLAYAGGQPAYHAAGRTLRLWTAPESPLARQLDELRIDSQSLTADAPLRPGEVLLWDAARPAGDFPWHDSRQALWQGADIVVYGAGPADAGWLSALAGQAVSVGVPPYRMWDGRGYRVGHHRLTAGLSHADLYWKRYVGRESAGAQAEDPSLVIEPLQTASVSAAGATELVFPGALVELPAGQGRLILDQRRWATTHEALAAFARRQASALLLGAGVLPGPHRPPRALPGRVTYRTLDLEPFATRARTDPGTGGEAGFIGAGPGSDLRAFPAGSRSFLGVPFDVGADPAGAIVLAHAARAGAETLPESVTLPIEGPAAGLYFLHTAAFSGETLGVYEIQYVDDTVETIELRRDVNLRDWTARPEPFARERDTRSVVAWTGSTPEWPLVAVYRMLWINPRPKTALRAVRFANPAREAMPVLLGLTVVLAKEAEAPPADPEKANALTARARAAMAAGREAEALGMLHEARQADPSAEAPFPPLADLLEKAGDEKALLALYRAWIQAGATAPLPHNRVGEILEKRGDRRGALNAYTQSLEVEWNQPPIIENKERLERELAP